MMRVRGHVWVLLPALALALGAGGMGAVAAQGKERKGLIAEAERAYREQDWAASVAKYREAFALEPGSAVEYARTADLLRMLGQSEEAVAMAREGIRHHPSDVKLQVDLGAYLSGAGRFEEAFGHFQELDGKVRKAKPDVRDDVYYFYYGAAADGAGRQEEAVRLFERAVALAPFEDLPHQAARSLNYLGYLLLEQNRNLDRAVELIHQANELHPDQVAYVDSLGWANFRTGRYPEALLELLRAERLMRENEEMDPVVLDHIAQAYFRLGHRDKAIEYLGRAIELAPEEAELRARREAFRKGETVAPVPLDFLKGLGDAGDKRRGRRR